MTEPTSRQSPGVERTGRPPRHRTDSPVARRRRPAHRPCGHRQDHGDTQLTAELGAHGHRVLHCSPSPAERTAPSSGSSTCWPTSPTTPSPHWPPTKEPSWKRPCSARCAGTGPGRRGRARRRREDWSCGSRSARSSPCCAARALPAVVDDTQWLDRATADVLKYIARRAGPGFSVLATLRTGTEPGPPRRPGGRAVLELCRGRSAESRVPPMTAHEVGELLERHDQPLWPRPARRAPASRERRQPPYGTGTQRRSRRTRPDLGTTARNCPTHRSAPRAGLPSPADPRPDRRPSRRRPADAGHRGHRLTPHGGVAAARGPPPRRGRPGRLRAGWTSSASCRRPTTGPSGSWIR